MVTSFGNVDETTTSRACTQRGDADTCIWADRRRAEFPIFTHSTEDSVVREACKGDCTPRSLSNGIDSNLRHTRRRFRKEHLQKNLQGFTPGNLRSTTISGFLYPPTWSSTWLPLQVSCTPLHRTTGTSVIISSSNWKGCGNSLVCSLQSAP